MAACPVGELRERAAKLAFQTSDIGAVADALEPFVHPNGILAHALADDIERDLVIAKGAAGDAREDGQCVIPREFVAREVEALAGEATGILEDAGRFTGKRFDLASDELTGNDVIAILSRVTGRSFAYYQVPLDVIRQRMGEDAVKMYEWFDRVGFAVDRVALRREFPDVAFHDFESWAKTQDWNALL